MQMDGTSHAADKGHVDVAKALIQNGVPDAVQQEKMTPLHQTGSKGHVDVANSCRERCRRECC